MSVPLEQRYRLNDNWSDCTSCVASRQALEAAKTEYDKVNAESEHELQALRKRMKKLEAENFQLLSVVPRRRISGELKSVASGRPISSQVISP
jgi:glutaredoxin